MAEASTSESDTKQDDSEGANGAAVPDVLVLVDSPHEFDRRVQAMLVDLRASGYAATVLNILDPLPVVGLKSKALALWKTLFDLLAILFGGLLYFKNFRAFWTQQNIARYRLPVFGRTLMKISHVASAIYQGHVLRAHRSFPDLVVANDLMAGVVGRALLGRHATQRLYYDAHEMSPFRNRRKNSFGRAAVALAVESWVAKSAMRMSCVSRALCDVCEALYHPRNIEYVPNSYYLRVDGEARSMLPGQPLHIVYFGAPSLGRGLNVLGRIAVLRKDIKITMFVPAHLGFDPSLRYLPDLPNVTLVRNFEYDSQLHGLLESSETLMSWCVIEDLCLSYRLAEPSKFHQSCRVGIPVIVAQSQHLAEIIEIKGNGICLDDATLARPDLAIAAIEQTLSTRGAYLAVASHHALEETRKTVGWTWK